jgi:hypothetical protein
MPDRYLPPNSLLSTADQGAGSASQTPPALIELEVMRKAIFRRYRRDYFYSSFLYFYSYKEWLSHLCLRLTFKRKFRRSHCVKLPTIRPLARLDKRQVDLKVWITLLTST